MFYFPQKKKKKKNNNNKKTAFIYHISLSLPLSITAILFIIITASYLFSTRVTVVIELTWSGSTFNFHTWTACDRPGWKHVPSTASDVTIFNCFDT